MLCYAISGAYVDYCDRNRLRLVCPPSQTKNNFMMFKPFWLKVHHNLQSNQQGMLEQGPVRFGNENIVNGKHGN